ncbi:MAG: hypothetical protein QOH04_888 [Sphingomonadales bacterium]|nr:hypothetical protein [Sphingomonadales bacterium]
MTRAACLLLAAAALPLAPALAQDTQTTPPPPATEPAPPPAAQAPAPEPAPPPAQPVATPIPDVTAAPAPAPVRTTTARTTTARTTTRAPAPRAVVRTPAVRTAVRTAPPAAAAAPAAAATAPVAAPIAAPPPEVAPTTAPVPIAAAPPTGVDTVAPAPAPVPSRGTALWPWLLLGALLVVGALAFALRRRRRAVSQDVYETEPETVVAPQPEVVAAPAAVAEVGEAEIELGMQPVRAGIAGDDARVEFRLTVGNRGSAPAEDVRVSTWMLAAGSSEMERALIEPRADAADTPPVTIGAGESRTMEAAVALPRSEVEGDALLPVVVADAAWRMSDGRERHTRMSYAVGVPDGDELAHFDVENPSGLHEGVVAQALGEPERS